MEHLVHLEILGQLEQLDRRALMVQLVLPVLRVQVVPLVILDLKVHLDLKDHEVLPGIKVELAIRVLPVHRDLKGSVVLWAPVDRSEILDLLGLRVELDGQVQ